MPHEETGVPFVQPLADLVVRGHDGDSTHLCILRLTAESLTLIPCAQAATDLERGAADDVAGPQQAPPIIRWVLGKVLGAEMAGVQRAFAPHPLGETEVTLAGPYLHVRLGYFDVEYGAGEFDPVAAAAFVQQYHRARAHAGD